MRRFLQKILTGPIIKLANKFGSRPDAARVHKALSGLFENIQVNPGKRGLQLELTINSRIILFSDQHKGTRNYADDFAASEKTYLAALEHYNKEGFLFCSMGDCEELWENKLDAVLASNTACFEMEKQFLQRGAFLKLFGNHDLYWDNAPLAGFTLEKLYGQKLKVYEGIIFHTRVRDTTLHIFITHGHQGDLQSDGNWFSKWFVSIIWARLQAYLRINPNTPAYDNQLKSEHNTIMYGWTAQQSNLALITGHTHQPVFNSLTHLERLYLQLEAAKQTGDTNTITQIEHTLREGKFSGTASSRIDDSKNTYFNTGCCCFNDGDITGIELEAGKIRLVKWKSDSNGVNRIVLEEDGWEALLDVPPAPEAP